jgi:hypothetical protein
MMRSPGAAFDLRAALVDEVRSAYECFARDPANPGAMHRSRLALKRACALSKVGAVSAPGLSEVFGDGARALQRTLSRACDAWTLEQSARMLAKKAGKKRIRRELRALADRAEAQQRAAAPLNAEAILTDLNNLLRIAQVWPDASERQVARGAQRLARRARKGWRRAFDETSPKLRHAWRKCEKDRFYAASLLGSAWPQDEPRRRKRNQALGEALGRERDLLSVMERLATDRPANGDQRPIKALGKLRRRLARRARKLGAKLHAGGV